MADVSDSCHVSFDTIVLEMHISEIGVDQDSKLLRVFERKVLRRIYGPTKESDGTWRIKTNDELNRMIGNKNIINYIKAQRLAWFGHVHRMPDNSMVKRYMSGHPR